MQDYLHDPFQSYLKINERKKYVGLTSLIQATLCVENKKPELKNSNKLDFLFRFYLFVIAIGFEPMTVCLEGRCSIQLSYATNYLLSGANIKL